MTSARPTPSRLVLVGGGHAHAGVLLEFGRRRPPGVRITIVAREIQAPYSGMLPGLVGGNYGFDECHFDLIGLAEFAGARVVHGAVDGVDPEARRISIRNQPDLEFDLLSLDVGLAPGVSTIHGAARFGLAVKPISTFWPRWTEVLDRALKPGGPRQFVVIGGGPAGYEISLAIRKRVIAAAEAPGSREADSFGFCLVTAGRLLETFGERVRGMARAQLAQAGIVLVEGERVEEITASGIALSGGRRLPCQVPVLCTDGAAPSWLAGSGLACDERGFALIRPSLQLVDHGHIFAAGDCASLVGRPLPKAGVFAVRQSPYLADNLRRSLEGKALRNYRPQRKFLSLLSNSRKSAIAVRGKWALQGRLMWLWKDFIDRRFMRRFRDLPGRGG